MIYNNYNDSLLSDNIYSRDVSGRELAIYKNGSIDQWNIYGMDNIGFIDGNEDIRFYMKDHLGSIRAEVPYGGVPEKRRRLRRGRFFGAPATARIFYFLSVLESLRLMKVQSKDNIQLFI